jgi:hypothetical protein
MRLRMEIKQETPLVCWSRTSGVLILTNNKPLRCQQKSPVKLHQKLDNFGQKRR